MSIETERGGDGPVLVTGGTGTLGTLVVRRLVDAGRDVRVLSRRAGGAEGGPPVLTGDLDTGEGVDAALAGVEVVVHCAGASKGDERRAAALGAAALRAGTRHLVNISVVGADRVPVTGRADRAMFSYYASKFGSDEAIASSGVPWTTLRATQFHELMLMVARGMAHLPVVPVPSGMRVQPVAADEVAARLVELSLGAPAGLVDEMAGPRIMGMDEMVRAYLRARGARRLLMPVPLIGGAGRAIRAGANLAPDLAVGRQTWEEFLAERLGEGVPGGRDRPRRQEAVTRSANPG
ncbi:MAG: SDR family oxidoreductase [Thermoleophilia bacterium]